MTFEQIYRLSEGIEELENHKMSKEQIDNYNNSMEKTLLDKIFFNEHIPHYDLLCDFGTARGDLIKATYPYDTEALYIGYDISEQMLEEAKANVGKKPNVIYTTKWDTVKEAVSRYNSQNKITLLTLNSVLHEVYSYSNSGQYSKFWSQAFRSNFTYVSIRDMMMRKKDYDKKLDNINEVRDKLLSMEHGEEKVESFEDIYGKLSTEGELIHLLMKWNFWNNWEREVHENYLGITIEEFYKKINSAGGKNYKVSYWQPFTLPYLKNWVKEQVGYEITVPTHIKLLLKKT